MKRIVLGTLAAVVLSATPALAGSASTTFTVATTVLTNCQIVAVGITFTSYDFGSSTADDATGTLTVTCTAGTPVKVKLGQGGNADTGSTDAAPLRRMLGPLSSDFLSYGIYQNSNRTTVWGNTDATGESFTTSLTPSILTMYGRLPIGQNSSAGAYLDTVSATVTF